MADMREMLSEQIDWSLRTFGQGMRTEGNCRHIEKELAEIREDPTDLEEWIDVAMLAFDGAWRCGASPDDILRQYRAKLTKNMNRQWQLSASQDEPNLHVREAHESTSGSIA